MNAETLLRELEERGVVLRASGDRLQVDAPAGAVSDEAKQALTALKANLLTLLSAAESPAPPDAGDAVMRLREGLSRGLRHWEDDRLVALALWHLALAFQRGGACGFRRHLPPSLARLTDDELWALVDWPTLATLERALYQSAGEEAARLSSGAQQLAAWWNARPARSTKNARSSDRASSTVTELTRRLPDA